MKLKHWQELFHLIVNIIYNSTKYNPNQNWNNKTCQCEYKCYCTFKKDSSKYLKSIVDT